MRKLSFIFFLWIVSITFSMAQDFNIQQTISGVQEKYAPDRRTEIFEVDALEEGDTLILKGETSNKAAYDELIGVAKKNHENVKDSIRLLPDEELGEQNCGIIYNSTGTIHSEPRYGSETVSQVLLGTPVKVLERNGGWWRIQMPDKYIGWINGSVKRLSLQELNAYNKQPKIVITALHSTSFSQADAASQPVSDLVAGNMLELKDEKGDFYRISYPNGREAFVKKADAQKLPDWLKSIRLTGESIVSVAKRFMGVPYVWGGTSAKGLDCSGFTKTVYFLHGIILQRDASQQVLTGKLIDDTGDFNNAQPGDLVFFGTKASPENPKERVVHVGIYIGNKRFVHASDYIRINSFDPQDPLYDEYNTNRYLRTKRIIGEVNTQGIEEVFKNEFYR